MAFSKKDPGKETTSNVRGHKSGEKRKPTVVVATSKRGAVSTSVSAADKIILARKGVSKKQLKDIKDEAELDYDQLSNILATSRSSLISKKGTARFNQDTSERILLLKDVITYGQEVFGDKNVLNEWLKTPSEALGNVTPLSMIDTFYGIDEVKKELGRIAYGVY
jgi:putative toxin-antitoxin system antitoxin component (TIGR02293 family)